MDAEPDPSSSHFPTNNDLKMLEQVQRETFWYFTHEINEKNGLIADKTEPGSPASVCVLGMGITAYIVGVERKLTNRSSAIERILTILRFLNSSHQGSEADATGYKGFYYHFLDMTSGKRALQCELSTIDTALLLAGVLSAASYFDADTPKEREIRELANLIYRRVDWKWALNGGTTLSHGWKPESGFLPYRWNTGYCEALILYILALGSPTFPIEERGYNEWLATFEWKRVNELEYAYAGPLFIHQFSHIWIDFRGIYDKFNRKVGIDYFENSRRATLAQRQYAIENPLGFPHYGKNVWGFTASNGPGPANLKIDGRDRVFFDYIARGAPFGPDDGTVAPWAVVASLPFSPEIVIETIHHAIEKLNLKNSDEYGFVPSFNPEYPDKTNNPHGWVSPWRFGLNQGPIVIMIENYRSELIWQIMKQSPYIYKGLVRAGFQGGWLLTHLAGTESPQKNHES